MIIKGIDIPKELAEKYKVLESRKAPKPTEPDEYDSQWVMLIIKSNKYNKSKN